MCCLRGHGIGGEVAQAQWRKLCRDHFCLHTSELFCSTLFRLHATLPAFQPESRQGCGDVPKCPPASVLPSLPTASSFYAAVTEAQSGQMTNNSDMWGLGFRRPQGQGRGPSLRRASCGTMAGQRASQGESKGAAGQPPAQPLYNLPESTGEGGVP